VENKRADILQIQKYLNGELDAAAMHRLEREAQDDPFLMDALEGYGRAGKQQDNLASLQGRLQARTDAKTRRMMPWTVIAIAASVIGFAVVTGVLYNRNDKAPALKVAMNQQVKSVQPADTTAIAAKGAGPIAIQPDIQKGAISNYVPTKDQRSVITDKNATRPAIAMREISIKGDDILKKVPEVTPFEDAVAADYIADKRKDTVLGGGYVAINKNPSLTVLKSKAEGADITVRPGKLSDNNPSALLNAGLPSSLVSGVVLNRMDGSPLPGVSVQIVGKPAATQTDVNGKFTMPNVKKNETLAFGSVGYNTKTLNVKGADSLKVELDASSNSLSEVVVTKATGQKRKASAHPATGWDSFNKYLKENSIAADGKEGVVTLQFTVDPKGNVTGINVTKSLSVEADKAAIAFIKQGPAWVGNINGKAEVVKVRVAFHKKASE
jgi:TonB family protein